MPMNYRRRSLAWAANAARVSYPSDVLAPTQSLSAALTDLDCAYESDLDTVRSSDVSEVLKTQVMSTLRQRHQERRARIVRQLEEAQRRAVTAG